jgi:HEAT repeat protein
MVCVWAYASGDELQALATAVSQAERQSAEEAILQQGPLAVATLRAGLWQGDPQASIRCLSLLGELKARQAVADILRLCQTTDDGTVFVMACRALGEIQDTRATPYLLQLARSADAPFVRRRSAIINIGLLGDPRAGPALKELLGDADPAIRVLVAGSLGLLGEQAGLDAAIEASRSTDPSLRFNGLHALGAIGSTKAVERLKEALAQGLPVAPRQAAELAVVVAETNSLSKVGRIPALRARIQAEPSLTHVATWCLKELSKAPEPAAAEALAEVAASHAASNVRAHATRMLRIRSAASAVRGGIPNEP